MQCKRRGKEKKQEDNPHVQEESYCQFSEFFFFNFEEPLAHPYPGVPQCKRHHANENGKQYPDDESPEKKIPKEDYFVGLHEMKGSV